MPLFHIFYPQTPKARQLDELSHERNGRSLLPGRVAPLRKETAEALQEPEQRHPKPRLGLKVSIFLDLKGQGRLKLPSLNPNETPKP